MDGHDYSGDPIVADMAKQRRKVTGSFGCLSPWSIFSHWLCWLDKKSKGQRRRLEREKVEKPKNTEKAKGQCSSSASDESGQYTNNEASFNVGVGFGLVYLMAASTNEVKKMMELRTQMEMLLQNLREKLPIQWKDTLKPSASNIETNPVCSRSLNCDTSNQETSTDGMEHLEAELEAELERLELHLDTEVMGKYTEQERIERRLCEILELRQQERIKELEAALECAMDKLNETEREVAWWRDTARLISQRLPDTPPLLK
ncbi:unnamed protein product [Ilex paraguariensis]|uniref:Uncharacterized protein n=1 Tax=Ilex paraguariensis TaxID=185542 RepID=A0ABC8RXA1_9AQUA